MSIPLRVLMLEDNPLDAELVLRALRHGGYAPDWQRVESEADYLATLAPGFDIILSDYEMPSFSAPRALELLKQSGFDIPFIIISGTIGEDVAVDAMRQGASDYLLKDRLARLGLSINTALEQAKLRRVALETQHKLRQSEERFRQLAENIHEVFWSTDVAKNQMLYVSPAYETIWGRTCESLYASPQTWMEAVHPDDRDRVICAAVARQLDGSYDEEYRIVRPDGSQRWIRDRAFPVRNDKGEVYRVVGLARDVTDRVQSHEQLREQASLLDKARDAILVRDLEHRITYWNKGAEQLYGWEAAEVLGRKISELIYRDAGPFEAATAVALEHGEWIGELEQVNRADVPILVEARWTLVRDEKGAPHSILAINTDITEKKRMEQQFLRAQRLENIGTLAGGIAHDLNNVLSPILMSIGLLRLTSSDDRSKSMLTTIETSAKRGADMVRQILSFARGVEGQRTPLDVSLIIKDVQHLVQETFPKNLQVHCSIADDLPAVMGDHTQLHQILLNLCVNARDAMPSGGMLTITAVSTAVDALAASTQSEARACPYVLIKVIDTGTGMPPELVDKIFDPFFTTKEVGKGTGLGLSTVLAIVKSHGGFLEVQSEPGRGTTFAIFLPSNISSSEPQASLPVEALPRGHGELILIVDDEAAVRAIARETLEAFGYRVLSAADGTEALSLYSVHQAEIAAVVTDLMMPVMDGSVTIQVLKRINPKVKVIAGSGIATEGTSARMAELGVKHFLPKPYTTQDVLGALNLVLRSAG
ncbi:MAG: PAS domain S-box protein [Prosthecobacter sp.]